MMNVLISLILCLNAHAIPASFFRLIEENGIRDDIVQMVEPLGSSVLSLQVLNAGKSYLAEKGYFKGSARESNCELSLAVSFRENLDLLISISRKEPGSSIEFLEYLRDYTENIVSTKPVRVK